MAVYKIMLNSDYVMDCGKNVASLWGGECFGYEVSEDQKEYTFHCIEHGELFDTVLKSEELKEYEEHPYTNNYTELYKKG